jgi:type I restriction enzyme S subunit
MSAIPENWIETEIGGLCLLKNGRAFKPSEWHTSGLPIVRIQNLNNPATAFNYFQGEVGERNVLRGGELLFAWSGTPGTSFGAHVWRGGDAVLNQHIFRVDFDEALLDKRFFRSAINQKLTELIDVAHGGVGLRHVTKGVFEKTLVALPPRPEQTRIANQLDTLLARVQACNDRFAAIPALLKRFRQTVLDAATSGGLTEDWRALEDLKPCDWETVALQDVITEMRNGLAQKPTESPPGSKILRIGAVRSGQLNLDDHRYLVVSDKEAEQYSLKQDDLLFTRYNGSLEFVGVCAALVHDAPGYVYPDKLIRVRVHAGRTIAKFIEIVFGCRRMRTQVEGFVKSSAGQRGISGADLKAAKFLLPPISEQAEIVRRVDALFAFADRIEARCTAARAKAQRLTPLVLAKAFRGELVPQDPNDEPASELLQRIELAKTAAAKPEKKATIGRKQAARKTVTA